MRSEIRARSPRIALYVATTTLVFSLALYALFINQHLQEARGVLIKIGALHIPVATAGGLTSLYALIKYHSPAALGLLCAHALTMAWYILMSFS